METATKDTASRTVAFSPSNLTQVLLEPHDTDITAAAGGSAPSKTSERSRRRWGAWATAAWFVAASGTALIVAALAETWVGGSNAGEVASTIIDVAGKSAMLGVLVLAAYLSRRPVADYLSLIRPHRDQAGEIAIVALAALAAPILILFVLGPALGFGPPTGPQTGTTLAMSFLTWIASGFFTPFVEELVFRGFLYRGFAESRLGAAGAIVLTAALFTAIHFPEFVGSAAWYLDVLRITLVALLFGWLRERTGSVLPSWGIHTLINAAQAPVLIHLLTWH
jgi:membrane protease YdiL (CAAX protease family)